MNTHTLPTAQQLQDRLHERLSPHRLEVLDESAQHAGHSGAGDDRSSAQKSGEAAVAPGRAMPPDT